MKRKLFLSGVTGLVTLVFLLKLSQVLLNQCGLRIQLRFKVLLSSGIVSLEMALLLILPHSRMPAVRRY